MASVYYKKVGTDCTIANTAADAGASNLWSGTSALCSGYYVTIAGSKFVLPDYCNNLFYGSKSINGLNKVDASNCMSMNSLFERSNESIYNLSGWDVSKVTSMRNLFSGCDARYIYVDGWDVSNVKDFRSAFAGITNMNVLDLTSWYPSSAVNSDGLDGMFSGSTGFRYIKVADGSDWLISTGANGVDMFKDDTLLPNFTAGELDSTRANTIKNFGYFTGVKMWKPFKVYMKV